MTTEVTCVKRPAALVSNRPAAEVEVRLTVVSPVTFAGYRRVPGLDSDDGRSGPAATVWGQCEIIVLAVG